jgi:hypothetical protein
MTFQEFRNLNCRLCYGELIEKFNLTILQKYSIRYYECSFCHSLQTESPYWLNEAYSEHKFNTDTGSIQRNINNFAICLTLSKIFSVEIAIDFGAKDGMLCRFLRDHEINCYAYDKYTQPRYAIDFNDPPKKNVDLLMAFEVLEHFPNPCEDLEEIFSFNPKLFLCSTELYNSHKNDWWYLATEGGQHVFFYSADAIYFIAKKYGYKVVQVGSSLLFYKPEIPNISNMIVSAQTVLSGWIFQAIKSYIFILPTNGVSKDYELIQSKLNNQKNI